MTDLQLQHLNLLVAAFDNTEVGVLDTEHDDIDPRILQTLWKQRLATYCGDHLWRASLGALAYYRRGRLPNLPDRTLLTAVRHAVTYQDEPPYASEVVRAIPYSGPAIRPVLNHLVETGELKRVKTRKPGNGWAYAPA